MGRNNSQSDVFNYIDTHNNDPDVCWEWTGSLSGRDGRGYFWLDGKRKLSYRVVYELFFGEIVEGMVIRHKCDNPICCNPKHLVIGTRGNNEKDKYDRDRQGYTNDMIVEMRRLSKLGMTYQAITDEVNRKFKTSISTSGVGKVLRGERRT